MRVLIAVLLVATGLSGCASTESPSPDGPVDVPDEVYALLPVDDIFVTASDGKRMHTALYMPDIPDGMQVPVFINFSPYWGNTAETGGDGFGQYLLEHLVPAGYAVVLASVRGTGHSEGCFEVASDREVQDLYEVIDFFATQSWSNGAVAVGGKSYDSTTQNGLIAKMPHPALKGVFHVSGITDMYRYNYVNGVPYANGLTFTPRYAATYSADGDHPDGIAAQLLDTACPEMAEHVASGTGSAASGLKDAYWIERDWTRTIGQSEWNGSIFFVHGFQDWNVKPDHILPWIDNLPGQVRVKGWLHQDTENSGHVYPMRADWNATMLAWLEHELKGVDNGFWDAPAWDVEGTDGQWRAMADWPAIPLEVEASFLAPKVSASSSVTSIIELSESPFANATGHIRISGTPLVAIQGTGANPDTVLTAVFRVNGAWVGEGVLRAIYDDGLELPSPVMPNDSFDFEAYPLDVVLAPGDVLSVEFGGAVRHAIVTPAQQSGFVPSGTQVWLPFASADARAEQPVATDCFAC